MDWTTVYYAMTWVRSRQIIKRAHHMIKNVSTDGACEYKYKSGDNGKDDESISDLSSIDTDASENSDEILQNIITSETLTCNICDRNGCTSCEQKLMKCFNDDTESVTFASEVLSNGIDKMLHRMVLSNNDIAVASDNTPVGKLAMSDNIDDKLFQDPPPKLDCPICMIPMPFANGFERFNKTYQACCGKVICNGCTKAASIKMNKGELKSCCPFCRVPVPNSNKEYVEMVKKRMKLKDGEAFFILGCEYSFGCSGIPHDINRAIELWHKGVEFGSLEAHIFIGSAYSNGEGVEEDIEKAMYYWKLAAIGGHEKARHNLGWVELEHNDNIDRAMKHFMIAARSGYDESLKVVGEGYKDGAVTKNEYANTLRAYQDSIDEMKSEERTKSSDIRHGRNGIRLHLLDKYL